MRNENTGFSIGPRYATFYKSGGGQVRLRNITLEQARDAAWILVPLGLILVVYGLEVFFLNDLAKRYVGLLAGYMVTAAFCLFRFKLDKVIIFGSLVYITVTLGESGAPALLSFDMVKLVVALALCITLASLPGFLERIWSHVGAVLLVIFATLPPTLAFQDASHVARLDSYDNELVGVVCFLIGAATLFQAYILYVMHRAVEEEKDLVIDDSFPHPDDYTTGC